MANQRGKVVDTTYLSLDQAEERGFIHRDYLAHALRWSHFIKCMYQRHAFETALILDIGCGRELPLAKMLYSSKLSPLMYYGVDAGPIPDESMQKVTKTGKFKCEIWEQTNILEIKPEEVTFHGNSLGKQLPNFVVCYEMLEHIEPAMMMQILEHVKTLTSDDCRYFISTPCWNRTDCAANHVNEMLYESLGAAFERHGFIVEHVYGTFASIRDYEHLMPRAQAGNEPRLGDIFDQLRQYYDTNFLSCIFAPLFPAQSRNALWELRKAKGGHDGKDNNEMKFPVIDDILKPWSSSAKWEEMAL